MKRRFPKHRTPKAARTRREGVVLLITAFVLLIISGTALFAIQQGLWEMRASGTALQSVRTRYVAESVLMAGLACVETQACIQSRPEAGVWRTEYGIPQRADRAESMYELRPDSITTGAMGFTTADIVQTDDILSGGGMAAVYTPDFRVVVEEWDLEHTTEAGKTASKSTRYVVTGYGELDVVGDTTLEGDTRQNNQSVSVSRAYYQITR